MQDRERDTAQLGCYIGLLSGLLDAANYYFPSLSLYQVLLFSILLAPTKQNSR